jgi:hypothetical protein
MRWKSVRIPNYAAFALASAAAALLIRPALGQSTSWTGNDSSSWSDPGNWTDGVPTSSGETVNLVNGNTTSINYDYTGPTVTLGPLILDNNVGGTETLSISNTAQAIITDSLQASARSVLTNNGSLTLDGDSTAPSLSGNGSLTIGNGNTPATLTLTGTSTVSTQNSLSINGMNIPAVSDAASTLEIGNNSLLISDGGNPHAAEAAIQQYIENGMGAVTADGGGQITSSFVNADPGYYGVAYADGSDPGVEDLNPGQIVIEPDILGDTDLNGVLTFHDLEFALGNYGSPGFWDQGNFNGDPTVDMSDVQDYLRNIPEPASLGLLASGVLLLAGRRVVRRSNDRLSQ